MDIAAMVQPILQLGLPSVLLIAFVKFFFDKDKAREKQIGELNELYEKREESHREDMSRLEAQYKDRERIITVENEQREGLLRKESDKREKIIIDAAEKREVSLMVTIEGFRDLIGKFEKTLKVISEAMVQVQQKIDGISEKLETR